MNTIKIKLSRKQNKIIGLMREDQAKLTLRITPRGSCYFIKGSRVNTTTFNILSNYGLIEYDYSEIKFLSSYTFYRLTELGKTIEL